MSMRTKTFIFLLSILGAIICSVNQASASEKNTKLYTPFTKISVPPGESVNFSIDLINQSEEKQTTDISITGLPHSWEYSLKSGNWTINQLSVLAGEKKSVSLNIKVPHQVNKGNYPFRIIAQGCDTLHLNIRVSEQGTNKSEFSCDQINMQGNSKSTFTYNAILKNQTAEEQLYALTAETPRGWNVNFKPDYKQATSVSVAANATKNVTIEVTAPATVAAGSYKIPLRASTSTTSAELAIEAVITGTYNMELTTPKGLLSTSLTAGENKKIELEVKNTGSAELKDIKLNATSPVDWSVTFEPSQIARLNAGESMRVIASVKASSKAIVGDYITRMEAKTPEATANAEFRISVKASILAGWLGVLIILVALGSVYYLFRKYGRR
ncbi:MAG: NEW3 domain-containing protein [Massilibacteroides sp.]|nr:NEW3 domain-containing protein [Massilibacteroides sp.]MDD3061577.1 NEW3 domain-containing protein [Massilibacteroides sp.]MDD4114945.1 NEW3 domain-containing protein [Massilibacteroides sp.]MDD4659134.1 NEW3 domain-containing protein [Massilibacteroides sp.]